MKSKTPFAARFTLPAVCLLICTLLTSPAHAQDPLQGDSLTGVLRSISTLVPADPENEFLVTMRSDFTCEAALLAWLAGDKEAIATAYTVLMEIAKDAGDEEDDFTRDYTRSYICLMLAAQGKGEEAERKARAIPTRTYRSYTIGLLAAERARAGDKAGYRRLSKESLDLLEATLKADLLLAEDMREWPSWSAWVLMDLWLDEAVYSGMLSTQEAKADLVAIAKRFADMGLEPGAEAEALGAVATGLADLGETALAWQWYGKASAALLAEQQRLNALGGDDEDWTYGVEPALIDMTRALIIMGDDEAAMAAVDQIGGYGMGAIANCIVATHLIRSGKPAEARPLLGEAELFIADVDKGIRELMDKRADGDNDFFAEYDSTSLFWDAYGIASDIARAGDIKRLERMIDMAKTPYMKIALQLGWLRATYQPQVVLQRAG